MIVAHGEGFHSAELAGHLQKLYPNESGSLDRLPFMSWCGRGGIYGLLRGGRTFGGLGLQGQHDRSSEINILMIHALKREQDQERISLKEGSSFQTLSQGSILIAQLHQYIERKTGIHLHPLKYHRKLDGKIKHRVNWIMIWPGSNQGLTGERIWKRTQFCDWTWPIATLSHRFNHIRWHDVQYNHSLLRVIF